MHPALIFLFIVLAVVLLALWQRQVKLKRDVYIRHFELPRGLFDKLRKRHPTLTQKDCQLVAQALRQFFLAHLHSGRRHVAMPSQVVDDLWHEYILYTRHYQDFCRKAFGRFLHHTPAVVLGAQRDANAGLRRCFWWACREDNINPRQPTRLPLLFAIDAKLNVPGGFRYVADCSAVRRQNDGGGGGAVYCGGDFASDGYDGGTDGFGDDGGGGGGDGDGGDGDGGDGGGGCGGGGE
jgi:hypothetical protein